MITYLLVKSFATSDKHPTLLYLLDNLSRNGNKTTLVKKVKYERWVDEITDITGRIDKLKEQIFKISGKVVLVGLSLGALEAAVAAIDNEKVAGLVVINGFFDKGITDRKLRNFRFNLSIGKFFNKKLKNLDDQLKSNEFGNIKCKVLVVTSADDEVLKLENSEWFYKNLSCDKEMFILSNGGHMVDADDSKKILVEKINQFCQSLIK